MNPNSDFQPTQPEQPQVQPLGTPYTQQGMPQIPSQQPVQPSYQQPSYQQQQVGYQAQPGVFPQQPDGQPAQQQPGQPNQQGQPGAQPQVNNFLAPPKASKKWLILTIVFITTTLAAGAAGVYAYMNYMDQRDNVDAKVSTAVNAGVKAQADKDAADFLEKDKQPNRLFAGPDDYGRLAFNYPKTWSIYVDKDSSSGTTYSAYFNPVSVPPVKSTTQYALRVTIEQKDVENVLASYDSLVKKGDLKTSAIKADDTDGTRLEGNFTKDIRGIAEVFKIRDKTVTVRTDAETFRGDFDALVATITFNK